MEAGNTFLDCPAYAGYDTTERCGLPAVVEDTYILGSTDGAVMCVKIRCPQGHWFSAAVDSLTVPAGVPDAGPVAAWR